MRRYTLLSLFVVALPVASCSSAPLPSRAPSTTSPVASAASPTPVATSAAVQPLKRAQSSAAGAAPHCDALQVSLPELIVKDFDVPIPPIVDGAGTALSPLYERLARLVRGRARDHVRIGMYGDSNMTRDYISGELRRTLQLKYGDGGHGFVSLGQPWSWYLHMDVRHGHDKDGWRPIAMSTHQVSDRLYGFAGIAVQSQRNGAVTWVETASAGAPVGTQVSRLDLYYLRRPRAGGLTIRVDGVTKGEVDADAPEVGAGFQLVEVEEGPHRVEFVAGKKSVRALGVTMERNAPGIVVDSLGIGGGNLPLMVNGDRKLAIETLRRRRYDLVIFLTGATEHASELHEKSLRTFIALHREALPGLPILVMSPPDLAGGPGKQPTRNPRLEPLAEEKKRIALELGCAFWDFRGAMGGPLSIVRFAEHKMAWTDYIHLSESGGHYMGRRFAYALLRDFQQYASSHREAGCGADR